MGSGDYFSKFALLITILIIAIVVYITEPFFSIILFSFFIAYLLVPLYSFLEHRTKHRRLAAAVSVFIALALFVLIGIRIIYAVVTQISTLLNSPESVQSLFRSITDRIIKLVARDVPFNYPEIGTQINKFISGLTDAYFPPTKTLVIFLTATLPFI